LTIHGERHYLWRAVDQDDNVLDIQVQSRRNKHAAKKFFRKLLKGLQYVPRVIITDKLKSYGAAKREILPVVEHRQSRYLNNRCENSHRPTRQREYRMQGFKSPGHAGIVKLLGMIVSPGNSRHFPDAMPADPTLRQPALYPLFRPNSRSGFSSLRGTPTRTTDAVAVGSVGQWDHTSIKSAGHDRGI